MWTKIAKYFVICFSYKYFTQKAKNIYFMWMEIVKYFVIFFSYIYFIKKSIKIWSTKKSVQYMNPK